MDDLGTVLFVLFLGNPLGLEGGEGGEGGSTGPDGVVSILGGDDLDHVLLGAHLVKFGLESVGESFVQSGSSGEDDVLVEVFSDIEIAVLDGGEAHLVHTESLVSFLDQLRVEDGLGAHESGGVDRHGLSIGELVALLDLGRLSSLLLVSLNILRDEADLLFHGSDDLVPGGLSSGLGDSVSGKEVDHVVGDGSSCYVVLSNCVGDRESFEDGDGMGDTVSRIADESGSSSVGVKGEDGLDSNVKSLDLEGLEHEGGHLLSVGLGVHRRFGKEDLVLTGVHSELVGEAVVPDLLHLGPRGDNSGLDGVGELEDSSHLLGFVSDVLRLGFSADHLLVRSGDSDDGGELNGGLVLSGDTGLDDTGSVIDNEGLIFRHNFLKFLKV